LGGGFEIPKSRYNKGANKALAAFRKRYGSKKGTQYFYAKSNKYGTKGKAAYQKANEVFGKGKHTVSSRRRIRG